MQPLASPMKLRVAFHNYVDDTMVSHTAMQLLDHMHAPPELAISMVGHSFAPNSRRSFTESAVPRVLQPLINRFDRDQTLRNKWTRRRFLREVPQADAVYLWPNTPLDVYQRVKEMGVPIFVERINTHRVRQREVLCREFAALGLDPEAHGVSRELLAREIAQLELTDYVFSASPMVHDSLIDGGIGPERIIDSSYGWSPERLRVDTFPPRAAGRFTAVFVGTLCIRKGVHRLLQAWAKSGVEGELLLAGTVTDLRSVPGIDELLARPDVRQLGYVDDIAPVYAASDLFVMPTLEEGGPMVTYEAMAFGLPVLVSPMGAGAVVRADVDGVVCDSSDIDGWARALRRFADDRELRQECGRSGRRHMQEFTWAKVGRRRREAVIERLRQRAGTASATATVPSGAQA